MGKQLFALTGPKAALAKAATLLNSRPLQQWC
jgi:hypothetical protein